MTFTMSSKLEHERIGLVIADVSDKGLPAALYMTVTRTLIRANISEHVSPASVLEEVNRLLFSESPEAMFITAVYAVLDTTRASCFTPTPGTTAR